MPRHQLVQVLVVDVAPVIVGRRYQRNARLGKRRWVESGLMVERKPSRPSFLNPISWAASRAHSTMLIRGMGDTALSWLKTMCGVFDAMSPRSAPASASFWISA